MSFVMHVQFGRLFGEVMRLWLGETLLPGGSANLTPEPSCDPTFCSNVSRRYAVVGAAALCGGVTRAISSAVFVFELTGELTHIMPVMCGVIVGIWHLLLLLLRGLSVDAAVGVGNFLSP